MACGQKPGQGTVRSVLICVCINIAKKRFLLHDEGFFCNGSIEKTQKSNKYFRPYLTTAPEYGKMVLLRTEHFGEEFVPQVHLEE